MSTAWPHPHRRPTTSFLPTLVPHFVRFSALFRLFPELSHIERKMSHPGDAPRVGLSKMCLLRVCRMTAHPVQHRAPCVQQLPNGFKSHLVAYCGVSGWKLSTRELRGSRAAPAFLLMECRKRSVWFCFGFFFSPKRSALRTWQGTELSTGSLGTNNHVCAPQILLHALCYRSAQCHCSWEMGDPQGSVSCASH